MKNIERIVLLVIVVLSSISMRAQTLENFFKAPPLCARPSTYWMWMNGNISKEGLTADLEYMKRASYGGAMMFNVGVGIPKGSVDYASPQWDEMTLHAVKEAERLGLELYLQNSPGYSGTGGPWITVENSMQQLEWTETMVVPDKKGLIELDLPQPYAKLGYYQDIKVLAFPALECETQLFPSLVTKVLLDDEEIDKNLFFDNDLESQVRMQRAGSVLTFELSQPFEARAVTVRRGKREKPLDPHDGPRDYAPDLKLEVSEDGRHYVDVSNISCPALRSMDTPGIALFEPVKGRYFRFITNRGTNISEVLLHASARLKDWTAKTNYVKDPVALGNYDSQDVTGQTIDPSSVIDITSLMNTDGRLKWKSPPGVKRWIILRMGSTTTGEVVAAAPDSGVGLDCDKFSKKALDQHFDNFLIPLLNKLKPWCGKTLKALMMDSWEAGKQNWTSSLPGYFKRHCGYDSTPWLLAMTGRIVRSIEDTERFLYDMRRTQTDMFNENFLAYFKEKAAQYGLKFAAEPYGDGNFESLEYAEVLDYPMSEFWVHYIYGGVTTSKMAASTSHLWNRPIVGAEYFTGTPFNSKLTEHPYAMKAEGDYMMTVGVNRFVYHVFAHQPYVGKTAGSLMTMGPFGTHLNRNSVWAEQAVGWNMYNARCAYLLQQGHYVADILYIKDEGISSGITDYDSACPMTPYGYCWDIGSRNVLQHLSVQNGRLVLPHGMSYRLLVLTPMKRCSPELLRQIKRLIGQGATVLLSSEKPEGYMGMDLVKDKAVKLLAAELWNMAGKENVYHSKDLRQVLKKCCISPDFSFIAENKDAQIHFIHRAVNGDDVYFVANHRRRMEKITATFRVTGKVPVLWDAETGNTGIPVAYKQENGVIKVTLTLQESGSVFIVFREEKIGRTITDDFKEVVPESVLSQPIFNTFTVSLWAKPETFAASGRGFLLFPDKGEERYGRGHAVVGIAMGQNGIRIYERTKTNNVVLESKTPIEGWTYVTLVYSDGIPTLYLNGKKEVTGKKSMFVCSPAYDVPMAEEQYIASFEGDQTKVRYIAEAWSPQEVQEEYIKGLPVPVLPEDSKMLLTLNTDWKVCFPVGSKAPAEIRMDVLASLHKHENFNIRHFSGKATYKKTFILTKKDLKSYSKIMLDLGRVENIAEISVNGENPVLVWKAPYRIDITSVVKAGENSITIDVTNLYPNRIIGDEYLSERYEYDEYGRIVKLPFWYVNQQADSNRERVLFIPWKYYKKTDPLLEAGLLGPVRIVGIFNEK